MTNLGIPLGLALGGYLLLKGKKSSLPDGVAAAFSGGMNPATPGDSVLANSAALAKAGRWDLAATLCAQYRGRKDTPKNNAAINAYLMGMDMTNNNITSIKSLSVMLRNSNLALLADTLDLKIAALQKTGVK